MGRTNNLNQQGQVRVETIAGPAVQIVTGTNSGLLASIARTGVGAYTLTFFEAIAPTTVLLFQAEGTTPAFLQATRVSETSYTVLAFTSAAGNAALDTGFSLSATQQFFG